MNQAHTIATNFLTKATFEFDLRKQIGNGGYGLVYEAYDPQIGAIVAVKKIPINTFTNAAAFFDESQKLYLTRHHNVAAVNGAGRDNDFVYISMPYYKKGSLKGLVDTRFLSAREIIRYSIQFLAGLNNIHSKGLIHFDIKLENILLSDANQSLISDFGLAQHTSQLGLSRQHGTTPVFAPPEMFTQEFHNVKFDIYQAGITIYRMCVGENVFLSQLENAVIENGQEDIEKLRTFILSGKFPDRSAYPPHIPIALKSVINKALNIDMNIRYSSVIDMLNGLSKIDFANEWIPQTDGNSIVNWVKGDYDVSVNNGGSTWDIKTTKNGRKITAKCATFRTERETNLFLYNCLTKEW